MKSPSLSQEKKRWPGFLAQRELRRCSGAAPVLLLGPSGSGKSCLARAIHERSGVKGPFAGVDCAASPGALLEAPLFGRGGALAKAAGGTLFLDEIGAISQALQRKLVKALRRPGGGPPAVRLISATRHDVQELLETGRLLREFFQCVNGTGVELRPLARRRREIMPLIEYFSAPGRRPKFSKQARAFLVAYDWPGNLRELKRFAALAAAGRAPVTLAAARNWLTWRFF